METKMWELGSSQHRPSTLQFVWHQLLRARPVQSRYSDERCGNSCWQRHKASPSDGLSGDGLQMMDTRTSLALGRGALEYPKQEGCESRKDGRWQLWRRWEEQVITRNYGRRTVGFIADFLQREEAAEAKFLPTSIIYKIISKYY